MHANMYYVYYMSIAVNSAEHYMLKRFERTGERSAVAVTKLETRRKAFEEHN